MTERSTRPVRPGTVRRGPAAVLALVLGVSGALTAGLTTAAHAADPGSISGTVTASRLDGLQVTLYSHVYGSGTGSSAVPVETVPVGPDGTYRIDGVAPNDGPVRPPGYTIQVSDTQGELATTWAPDVRTSADSSYLTGATWVTVTDGLDVTGVDVTVGKRVHLQGKVVDKDGHPVAGAQVSATSVASFGDTVVGSAVTAADGTYRTGQLPALGVNVVVRKDGYQTRIVGGTSPLSAQSFPIMDTDVTVDAVIGHAGSVSGTVSTPAAVPASSLKVRLLEAAPGPMGRVIYAQVATTTVGAGGRFEFADVATSPFGYVVEVTDPSLRAYAKSWAGDDWSPIFSQWVNPDADEHVVLPHLTMAPTGSVTGQLVSPRNGLSYAGVTLTYEATTCTGRCTLSPAGKVTLGADGRFTVRGLPGGSDGKRPQWTLRVTDPQGRFVEHVDFTAPAVTDGATTQLGRIALTLTDKAPLGRIDRVKTPKVTGTAKVGRTLKVSQGTWRPGAVKVTYQWQSRKVTKKGAKAVPVAKGTHSKVKLTRAVKGRKVRVKVTVKAPGHRTVTYTTKWTKKVA